MQTKRGEKKVEKKSSAEIFDKTVLDIHLLMEFFGVSSTNRATQEAIRRSAQIAAVCEGHRYFPRLVR